MHPPRVHAAGTTRIVHGEVDRGVRAPGALIIAPGARIMGDVEARGDVHLGRGASVAGAIRAMGDVILGAHSRVHHDVRAEGRVVVQTGALVTGAIDAAADAHLLPHARVNTLHAGGDLHVRQPVIAPKVRVGGRVFSSR